MKRLIVLCFLMSWPLFFLSADPLRHEPTEAFLYQHERQLGDVLNRIDTRNVCDQGIRPFGPKLEYYPCDAEEDLKIQLDQMLEEETQKYLIQD